MPTQSVSTVPTRGSMRKLRTAGTASFVIVESSASPRGRTRFFPVSPPTTLRLSSDALLRLVRWRRGVGGSRATTRLCAWRRSGARRWVRIVLSLLRSVCLARILRRLPWYVVVIGGLCCSVLHAVVAWLDSALRAICNYSSKSVSCYSVVVRARIERVTAVPINMLCWRLSNLPPRAARSRKGESGPQDASLRGLSKNRRRRRHADGRFARTPGERREHVYPTFTPSTRRANDDGREIRQSSTLC